MKIKLSFQEKSFIADLNKPLNISIPLSPVGPRCFYAPKAEFTPFTSGDFIGSIEQGSPVNFFNVIYNPHGNGTHTESNGHISKEMLSINNCLRSFHFIARLVSVNAKKSESGDFVIDADQFNWDEIKGAEALVIRTLPNSKSKLSMDYSGMDPAYLTKACMKAIVDSGIQHLLIDLPSVDKEEDEGALIAHKIFWNHLADDRSSCSITELIYVDDEILDDLYLLNLMISPIELDASSSKPVLYGLTDEGEN